MLYTDTGETFKQSLFELAMLTKTMSWEETQHCNYHLFKPTINSSSRREANFTNPNAPRPIGPKVS